MKQTNLHKMIAVFCLLFVVFGVVRGQENQSVYFKSAEPIGGEVMTEFPTELVSKYDGPDSTTRLIITKEAVMTRFYVLFTTTMDKVNSREDIYLENGEIHGLSESRSYPYTMGNDTVYFYYPNEITLFNLNDGPLIKVKKNTWMMNLLEENKLYTCVILELDGDSLYMRSFDHNMVWDTIEDLGTYKDKKVKGERAYVLDLEDGDMYDLLEGFTDSESYVKKLVE